MKSRAAGIAAILSLLMSGGCANTRSHTPPKLIFKADQSPEQTLKVNAQDQQKAKTLVARFLTAYDASYDEHRDATKARELASLGMTVIDTRCDLFFESIGRGAQNLDFARREIESISAAIIAVLGLASAGTDAVAGVGLGAALITGSMDNYTGVYFFSPEVSSVQVLVRKAFGALKADFLSPQHSPNDYNEAISILRTYQNVCTAHEIKRLVTEAIDTGVVVSRYPNGEAGVVNLAVDNALTAMGKQLGVGVVKLHEAVLLSWLVRKEPSAPDALTQDFVCGAFQSGLRDAVCEAATTDAQGAEGTVKIIAYKVKPVPFTDKQSGDFGIAYETLRALNPARLNQELESQVQIATASAGPARAAKVAQAEANVAKAAAVAAGAASAEDRAKLADAERKQQAAESRINALEQRVREGSALESAAPIGTSVVGAAQAPSP